MMTADDAQLMGFYHDAFVVEEARYVPSWWHWPEGWQDIAGQHGNRFVPPIEYTIRPGDTMEFWIAADHAYGPARFFRINGKGKPLPFE